MLNAGISGYGRYTIRLSADTGYRYVREPGRYVYTIILYVAQY
jgi:hypothetical protein